MESAVSFLLTGLRARYDAPPEEVIKIAESKMKHVCDSAARLHFRLYKKSFDARHKENILQVCSVLVTADQPVAFDRARLAATGGRVFSEEKPTVVYGRESLPARPLVVGMGPAGLFCALFLAEHGYRPILIDRGDCVEARALATERFRRTGVLDPESNIQFGAGGAGTFSDGKLVTRIGDPLCNYVLSRFTEFGAPEDILIKAKPHVGTDILRRVVAAILGRVEELGGTVRYRTPLLDFTETAGGVRAILPDGGLNAGALILAIGHSARDTFRVLMKKQLPMEPKPFSVGVRIEHLRRDIDRALYGAAAGHPALGAGEYALSDTTLDRGVYTFCMCPGGEVIAAASAPGGVVVNGMSYHARDGENSNSAVAVSVTPRDTGGSIQDGIAFQIALEESAFLAGGGDFTAPVQTVGDFMDGRWGTAPSRVLPTYGGGRVREADLRRVLPSFVSETLAAGLRSFDRKLPGFAVPDAVLTGVETRTSSPLRILRGEDRTAPGHPFVYPVGEGAGYAGGITSAALDGLRTALAVAARFAPLEKE